MFKLYETNVELVQTRIEEIQQQRPDFKVIFIDF